jgi:acyl-CoA thioesterase I
MSGTSTVRVPVGRGPGQYNGNTVLPRGSLRPASTTVLLVTLLGGAWACRQQKPADAAVSAPAPRAEVAATPKAGDEETDRPRVVALGDSLTAGLGLSKAEAYPAILQRQVDAAGYRFEVVNAGVSGDTTAGGLSRLDWSLDGDVRIVIVALGANDGLRGLPPDEMARNLSAIIRRIQDKRAVVLLAGMESPTNMGPEYQRRFRAVFPALARQHHLAFLPFLLDGVAGRPELNQADGIHPTAEGARIVADHLWTVLEPMLQAASR